jgi:hypothetical protein
VLIDAPFAVPVLATWERARHLLELAELWLEGLRAGVGGLGAAQ